MFEVDVNRRFLVDGKRSWKWVKKPVNEVKEGEETRCHWCKNPVRIHRGKKVRWHAEHLETADSETCCGGVVGKTGTKMPSPPRGA
jgi:hypothetical protein